MPKLPGDRIATAVPHCGIRAISTQFAISDAGTSATISTTTASACRLLNSAVASARSEERGKVATKLTVALREPVACCVTASGIDFIADGYPSCQVPQAVIGQRLSQRCEVSDSVLCVRASGRVDTHVTQGAPFRKHSQSKTLEFRAIGNHASFRTVKSVINFVDVLRGGAVQMASRFCRCIAREPEASVAMMTTGMN